MSNRQAYRPLGIATAISVAAALLAVPAVPAQDVARGWTLFAQCLPCHALAPDSGEAGPSLVGVVGRAAGSREDFRYSRAMLRSGVLWDAGALDGYLAAPQDFLPGTRMAFSGVESAEDRAALIEFLRSLK